MTLKGKLLILFIAVVVTLWGFNLIASSFLCLLETAEKTDSETLESYLVKSDGDASRRSLQSMSFNIFAFDSNLKK